MDLGALVGKQMGKLVEKAIVNAFSSDDKDEDKDGGARGILSLFRGDKDDKDDQKKKDKKDDDDGGGFFSKLLNRDDDDDKPKKSGFHGLFNEQQGAAGSTGGQEGQDHVGDALTLGGGGSGCSDGDLLSDLMDVAEEQSRRQ